MKKNNIYDLVLTSVFAAIILVMSFIPFLGFITIGPVSMTIIHIPVLIGVFLLPKKYSWMLGLFFGLGSFIRSFANTGVLDPAFQNPLVSVLPRVLFAVVAAWLFEFFRWINIKFAGKNYIFFAIVSLFTVIGFYYGGLAIVDLIGWSKNFVMPMILILAIVFLTVYYYMLEKLNKPQLIFIPTTFLLATVVHTILTLAAVGLFAFDFIKDYYASVDAIINFIFVTAMTNGLLEALLAVIVGVPLIYGISESKLGVSITF